MMPSLKRFKLPHRLSWRSGLAVLTLLSLPALVLVNQNALKLVPMYAFAAKGAPAGTKWLCVRQSRQRVAEKFDHQFKLPPDAIKALKQFWYYSLYRECLFQQGYDFDGTPVPESYIAGRVYHNLWGKFSFVVPAQSRILTDNQLDAERDDRRYQSQLQLGPVIVNLSYYRTYDYEDITELAEELALFTEPPSRVIKLSQLPNQSGWLVRQKDLTGLLFVKDQQVVHLYGRSLPEPIAKQIIDSFRFDQ